MSHYQVGGFETIDYIEAKCITEEFVGFCKGNVLKYVSRAGYKTENGVEDLLKARYYLDKWINTLDEFFKTLNKPFSE